MLIEVGKFYKTRNGQIAQITEKTDIETITFKFSGQIDFKKMDFAWVENGKYTLGEEEHPLDIISELSLIADDRLFTEQKFYMIYVEGASSPTVKHLTFEAADAEAERLAKNNLGKQVYILESKAEYVASVSCARSIHSLPNPQNTLTPALNS